jgi:hypothetical protein
MSLEPWDVHQTGMTGENVDVLTFRLKFSFIAFGGFLGRVQDYWVVGQKSN